VYEFLTDIGISPLVSDFIAHPEWLHVGTAFLLMLLILGSAYLLRIDLDPYLFGRNQPFSSLIERLAFWPSVIIILLWTYYGTWPWPDPQPQGLYFNKFTIGISLILLLIVGRAVIHFIHTEKNRWDFFDQLPFYLMVLFQFFVPLVYYYQLERNGLMPKEELGFAFASIFIFYFIARWALGRPTQLARNRVSPFLWLFIAYMLITVIFMPYRLAAIKNVIQWIIFAACFFIGFASIPDKRRRDAVLLTAVVAVLVSTLWGFWKYFDIPFHMFDMVNGTYPEGHLLAGQEYFYRTPGAGRYFLLAGFFANPNYYGEYLALTLFISLGLLLATDSKKLRIFLAITLAINSFEMIALYNRAGWLGIFSGTAFVLFGLAWARLPVFRRVSRVGLAAGAIGLVLVLALTGVIFNSRETDDTPLSLTPWQRLQSMTDFSGDETLRNRMTMWRAAGMMLTDPEHSPQLLIFGGGFGFFEVEYLPYQTKVLETYNFNDWFHNVIPTFRAHNDHLQMLVEAGIIGTALYAMFFIMFFIYGFRFLREEEDPARRFYALGILGATASILASAFFSFPLHKIQHGGLIFTAMALLLAEISERKILKNQAAEAASVSPPEPAKKKKHRKIPAQPLKKAETAKVTTFPGDPYLRIRTKLHPVISVVIILVSFLLCLWGVYTQIINFKSQFYVVKGIAALRNINASSTQDRKEYVGQVAANFFWRAYQLDPTNGRAEFFHGFALIKKNTYEDTLAGTRHLEEGQILYPQSDTFYALAMGYEARHNLATDLVNNMRGELTYLEGQLETDLGSSDRFAIQNRVDELNEQIITLDEDISYSHDRAIYAYMTAARYYPVKVEYYKELIRLLEEEQRYEDIVFWAERALVVYDWLDKKPKIRWQLSLWLGKSLRAIGAMALQEGRTADALEYWQSAEAALIEGVAESTEVYYNYYELAQVYEALGDVASESGNTEHAYDYYLLARDNYVQVFNKKDNVPSGQPPFDYAYYLLGRIYEKLGDPDRALDYYRQLMGGSLYSPNSETYQKTRTRYHTLTGEWYGEAQPGDEPGIISDTIEP